MLKALWFALKIGALIALAVWIADHPGTVRIEWAEYTFTFKHTGLFIALLLGFVLLTLFVYQTIKTFVGLPSSLRRYNEIKGREKGYEALTKGLTAVAAGDTKAAVQYSKRASKFLAGDTGLPLLLEAQAARLDGREEDANKSFVALLEDKNASFLGVRGLLQTALDNGDHDTALALCEKALKLHPRQGWILKIAYDLQVEMQLWYGAEKTLAKAEKHGAIDAETAKSDRLALYLAQAQKDINEGHRPDAVLMLKKAMKLQPGFVPASIMMAELELKDGSKSKAQKVISKAWKEAPHGALAYFWRDQLGADKEGDKLARLRWMEKLLKVNADSAAGQRITGQAALDAGLWGEAREFFKRSDEMGATSTLYQSLAELEERSSKDQSAIKEWLSKAANAPAEKVWVCRETGNIYDRWVPIAPPHGSFNTIVWDRPHAHKGPVLVLDEKSRMSEALIEAPEIDAA